MIRRLEVTGYQSLAAVALDLEPFTVIVGPSSSGKSALVRALRSVPTYQRGSSFLAAHDGTRAAVVALTLESPARGIPGPVVVSVHRAPDKNSYRVALDPAEPPAVFGKLAGSTPPEVSAVLGIPADSALAIAAQFDPPYLLAASSGDAHATLARLTGVTTLLRASREGNRRRLARLTAARTLGASLEGIRATLGETRFLTLEARRQALADAVAARTRLAARLERRATLDTARAAHARLIVLREHHRALSASFGTPTPALDHLARLTAARDTIAAARLALVRKRSTLESLARERSEVDASLEAALAARDEAMRAALLDTGTGGTCPTCGQALPRGLTIHSPVRPL